MGKGNSPAAYAARAKLSAIKVLIEYLRGLSINHGQRWQSFLLGRVPVHPLKVVMEVAGVEPASQSLSKRHRITDVHKSYHKNGRCQAKIPRILSQNETKYDRSEF